MKGGVALYLVGAGVLLALAGCGRGFMSGERAPWRHQAEVECMKSGSVKIGTGVVQIDPIEGPGMCGADFPLRVTVLGESNPLVGYADDPRPPGLIPNSAQMPRWPINQPQIAPPAPIPSAAPANAPRMRWVPGPLPAERPNAVAPPSQPMPLSAPSTDPGITPNTARLPDDIPDDAVLPPSRERSTYSPSPQPAPVYQPQERTYDSPTYNPPQRASPSLGPARRLQAKATMTPTVLTPPATLACPIVSALDHWVSESVQPAAMRWFGSPVTEIKQISAYSCRGMNGNPNAHISEHAFGNALDIAEFHLADGRVISVQHGWRGAAEEQGFLHDVQSAACDQFDTVLAPGANVYHYNHIHVDLMRRASGRRICEPSAIPGEVAAARAGGRFAAQRYGDRSDPGVTGSIASRPRRHEAAEDDERRPSAVAGED